MQRPMEPGAGARDSAQSLVLSRSVWASVDHREFLPRSHDTRIQALMFSLRTVRVWLATGHRPSVGPCLHTRALS